MLLNNTNVLERAHNPQANWGTGGDIAGGSRAVFGEGKVFLSALPADSRTPKGKDNGHYGSNLPFRTTGFFLFHAKFPESLIFLSW